MDSNHENPHAGLRPIDPLDQVSDDDEPKPTGFINEGDGIPLVEDEDLTSA